MKAALDCIVGNLEMSENFRALVQRWGVVQTSVWSDKNLSQYL